VHTSRLCVPPVLIPMLIHADTLLGWGGPGDLMSRSAGRAAAYRGHKILAYDGVHSFL
jgi:hypothetical protein